MSAHTLYSKLKQAKSEEDIKDAYIKALGLKGCLVPKLCLTFKSVKMNLFCSWTHQAELGNRHSQTGVWE
jgi:hypothetical protein